MVMLMMLAAVFFFRVGVSFDVVLDFSEVEFDVSLLGMGVNSFMRLFLCLFLYLFNSFDVLFFGVYRAERKGWRGQ